MITTPNIYIISDSLGETAEFVTRAAASQFNSGYVEIKKYPYVSNSMQIEEIINEVELEGGIIAYTLVIPGLKECLEKKAREKKIPVVDVMGPLLDTIIKVSGKKPHLEPGLIHKMDEEYFRRVEAIEFAVKYDDGKDPRGILHADIVLIGISRTSKTPLCMYLAHKRIKAANIPLIPEVAPPEEIFSLPRNKIIGLTAKPEVLTPIRQERLKSLGLAANADYANIKRIFEEIEYAEGIMKRLGCPIIDVSNRAVEEAASKVLQIFYRGECNEKM